MVMQNHDKSSFCLGKHKKFCSLGMVFIRFKVRQELQSRNFYCSWKKRLSIFGKVRGESFRIHEVVPSKAENCEIA